VELDACGALARLNLDGYFATVVAHAKLDLPDLGVPARRGEPEAFLPAAGDLDLDFRDFLVDKLVQTRMPPAGLEPAARCLEGRAEGYDPGRRGTTNPHSRHKSGGPSESGSAF
jgi:hypothetical protein